MNELQVFNNPEFGEVRTVTIDENIWFVGKDVAIALGYEKPLNALSSHVEKDDTLKRGVPTKNYFIKRIDIRPYKCQYLCTGIKRGEDVSPKGRPTSNKKTERLEIRLAPSELELLKECSERMGVTKTEVINEGVRLVKAELDKK